MWSELFAGAIGGVFTGMIIPYSSYYLTRRLNKIGIKLRARPAEKMPTWVNMTGIYGAACAKPTDAMKSESWILRDHFLFKKLFQYSISLSLFRLIQSFLLSIIINRVA